jgi:hypothetical protein
MIPYAPRPDRQASVHHLLPPPADLEQPEAEIWRVVVAQRNFNAAAAALLHSGLRMRAIARTAQTTVERDGMTVAGRYGPRLHPMLRIEKSSRYLFYQIFKQLHVKMELDDDDFAY